MSPAVDARELAAVSGKRKAWVDIARGIGIVLVVFGHVWRGLFESGLIDGDGIFRLVDDAVYLFHMPLFFVVSGMLFAPGVRRRGPWGSFLHRLMAIAYPYLLWSYINMYVKYLVGPYVNETVIFDEVLHAYFPPVMQFWFLFHLFFIQTLLSFVFLFGVQYSRMCVAIAGIAIVAAQIPGAGQALPAFVFPILPSLVFFVFGIVIGEGRLTLPDVPPRAIWAAGAAFLILQAAYAQLPPSVREPAAPIFAIACVMSVLFGTKALTRMGGAILPPLAKALAALGAASLAVYVTHVLFTAGVRIVLEQLEVTGLLVHCVLGAAIGLAGSYALFRAARSFDISAILGFGLAARVRNPAHA